MIAQKLKIPSEIKQHFTKKVLQLQFTNALLKIASKTISNLETMISTLEVAFAKPG